MARDGKCREEIGPTCLGLGERTERGGGVERCRGDVLLEGAMSKPGRFVAGCRGFGVAGSSLW